jgi:hypothetical protein
VAHLNVADPQSRPGAPTLALIDSVVDGEPTLQLIKAQSAADYVRTIAKHVKRWKSVLVTFIKRLLINGPGIQATGAKTHGSPLTKRWVLHLSSSQLPELQRNGNEMDAHVDMRSHPAQRTAILGLVMAQAMASGDDFMWVNEVELMWCSKHAPGQRLHVDGAIERVLSLLWSLLEGGGDKSTEHMVCCGAKWGDPTHMDQAQHAGRMQDMKTTFVDDIEAGTCKTSPPSLHGFTAEEWAIFLDTNAWHMGTAGDGINDRFLCFFSFLPFENNMITTAPSKTNTTNSVIFATDPVRVDATYHDVEADFTEVDPYTSMQVRTSTSSKKRRLARSKQAKPVTEDPFLITGAAKSPCEEQQELSRHAERIATNQPEAYDTRKHFMRTGRAIATPSDNGGMRINHHERHVRYIDGTAYPSIARHLAHVIADKNSAILTARRRWPPSALGHCVTPMGGDIVSMAWREDNLDPCEVRLQLPRTSDGDINAADAWCIVFTGTVECTKTQRSPYDALSNLTIYHTGPMCSLSVDPPNDMDSNGNLEHRLLYEGCGYQARAVPEADANTYYRVYWSENRDVPLVHLHLRTPMEPLAEITRPTLLAATTTVHVHLSGRN